MERQFQKHFTREQARALLPRVAQWIRRLQELHARLGQHENRLADLRNAGGADLGGPLVNAWTGDWAEVRKILWEFASRGILLKDIDRGLVDFPAIREGREVFLCWELGEADVEFWHELDTGYAGRTPFPP